MDIEQLQFDAAGLIPAIVRDTDNGQVLMLAYMNRASLEISLREGRTCFYSRSRRQLWRKGETSGNKQHIVAVEADCDGDALLVSVRKDGPACHTGAASCFHNPIYSGPEPAGFDLDSLYRLLHERQSQPQEGSYTSYLFSQGRDKILKKIGEEATEVIIGGKAGDQAETVYEIADLAYHILVLMADMGIEPAAIRQELASRQIIDHKRKQENRR